MECVRSAEFTIVLNGGGGGFFRPECGLRQGCSLSPYLFIFGMDILSRSLTDMVALGLLEGVKLARACQPITNVLYANDLLLLGKAKENEAALFIQALEAFSAVSGQVIGPAKSNIWFSKQTGLQQKEMISDLFQVSQEATSLTYLKAPIATTSQAFDFLIEAFTSRLQSWKCKLLNQAGRIVLIRSVLQSVPIYYMATIKVPLGVINKLNTIIRQFFWGKMDKPRYMAMVAWDKITQPIGLGG